MSLEKAMAGESPGELVINEDYLDQLRRQFGDDWTRGLQRDVSKLAQGSTVRFERPTQSATLIPDYNDSFAVVGILANDSRYRLELTDRGDIRHLSLAVGPKRVVGTYETGFYVSGNKRQAG